MEQDRQIQILMMKLDAYRLICKDLIIENKELKEKITEIENSTLL